MNTLRVDRNIFESGNKKLRIQKYPDTCGRGLSWKRKPFGNLLVCFLLHFKYIFNTLIQGHPTNLLPTLSVPQRNLAGWQKYTGVSISWLGNFVIDRGFALELLTFSSISTRAGCRNSED